MFDFFKETFEDKTKNGCGIEDLKKIQELINAKNSDIFDVLEYIAYAKPLISRKERVEGGKEKIFKPLNENESMFVSYLLKNYINSGIDELDISKLSTLLSARYGSINEAQKKLGTIKSIQDTFVSFQKHLYYQ